MSSERTLWPANSARGLLLPLPPLVLSFLQALLPLPPLAPAPALALQLPSLRRETLPSLLVIMLRVALRANETTDQLLHAA